MRFLLRSVCIFLLLVSQQEALTHQIAHLQDRTQTLLQQQDEGKQGMLSGSCLLHIAFAEVLGVACSGSHPLWLAANDAENADRYFVVEFPTDKVIPASRGPPVHL